jgi:type IV secretory pathway VirB4 component
MEAIRPETAPIIDDLVNMLAGMGTKRHVQQIARDLADEVAGLCTGTGPYARFVNARTNLDLSYRGSSTPRVFSFHEMTSDPELLALAYTQVLSAIRRDSLADENPRVIAVDEVYRLMRHPSLLDFLIEAVKTFRTRRKKVCVVDQQMSLFLDTNTKARLIFENCPIRVIFNQRGGMHVFKEDPAFSHFSPQHLEIIASLKRGFYVLDIANSGIHFLFARASSAELERFGST